MIEMFDFHGGLLQADEFFDTKDQMVHWIYERYCPHADKLVELLTMQSVTFNDPDVGEVVLDWVERGEEIEE